VVLDWQPRSLRTLFFHNTIVSIGTGLWNPLGKSSPIAWSLCVCHFQGNYKENERVGQASQLRPRPPSSSPYPCWSHIHGYSVYNIFSGRKLEDLISNNIIDPADIPSGFDLTDRQEIEIRSYKNGRTYSDKEKLRKFLDTLRYPLFYLDYETISPGIPLFDNSSSYQQVPFQFSLHVWHGKGGRSCRTCLTG
jgi:hypothetical protein